MEALLSSPRFLSIDDLTSMPAPSWAIEGLFEVGTLTMLAGPSYSFKSFLLLDWLLSMATGRQWQGRHTVSCKVVYALGEGKSSLLKRVQAWIVHNQPTEAELVALKDNLRITFEVPQLGSKASVDNMLADLDTAVFKPNIIAIDTFARSMVGLDENDARDTGLWIEQADRLRQLGFGVIFLHHTKKNTEFGVTYRGSSAIIGAMDTAMTLIRDHATCTLTVTKQKDHDEGAPIRFRLHPVSPGSPHESCVLVPDLVYDARFTEEAVTLRTAAEHLVETLMEDGTYPSDADRARVLSEKTGMSLSAAKMKISRSRK